MGALIGIGAVITKTQSRGGALIQKGVFIRMRVLNRIIMLLSQSLFMEQ